MRKRSGRWKSSGRSKGRKADAVRYVRDFENVAEDGNLPDEATGRKAHAVRYVGDFGNVADDGNLPDEATGRKAHAVRYVGDFENVADDGNLPGEGRGRKAHALRYGGESETLRTMEIFRAKQGTERSRRRLHQPDTRLPIQAVDGDEHQERKHEKHDREAMGVAVV